MRVHRVFFGLQVATGGQDGRHGEFLVALAIEPASPDRQAFRGDLLGDLRHGLRVEPPDSRPGNAAGVGPARVSVSR
jgi:hypothetical protein